jgi:hypothetical protein
VQLVFQDVGDRYLEEITGGRGQIEEQGEGALLNGAPVEVLTLIDINFTLAQ